MKRKDLFAKDTIKLLKDYDENLNLQSFHNKISRGKFNIFGTIQASFKY